MKVNEARERIMAIVQPPTADLGGIYNGRVVSITKFGAFVNILPGRDGLVHISKLGNGKRINNVEDVLELGQEIQVRVDDIDDKGKVSLSPVGEGFESSGDAAPPREERAPRAPREERAPRAERSDAPDNAVAVSFEDEFESELTGELGDLGPGREAGNRGGGRGDDNRRRHR